MVLEKSFQEANKIVPFKKLFPFLLFIVIVGIIIVLTTVFRSETSNKEFYEVQIQGKINDTFKEPGNRYFQIGTKWYLIKDECIDYIELGDSISKMQESYNLVLFDEASANIKYEKETKRLTFKEVKTPK